MKALTLCLLSTITLMSGCATPPDYFWADHAQYQPNHQAELRGSAVVRVEDGTTFACQEVALFPRTSHYEEKIKFGELTAREWSLAPKARCDAEGDYAIQNLPEASWIMIAVVPAPEVRLSHRKTDYPYWLMARSATTRAYTSDEVFMYASSSEWRYWDTMSFVDDHKWSKEETRSRTWVSKQQYTLPWGTKGDK